MNNRDRFAVRHMRDHAREAVELTRDKSRADLNTHRLLNLALVRLVEIIGEAASRQCRARAECGVAGSWPDRQRAVLAFPAFAAAASQ